MAERKVPATSEPAQTDGPSYLWEGRWSGGLLVAQIAGLIGPFILLLPLVRLGPLEPIDPGHVPQVRAAVYWLALNALTALAITTASWRSLAGQKGLRAALLAMAAAVFILQWIDNAHILTLATLHSSGAGAGDATRVLTEAEQVTRGWIHRSELLAVDLWVGMFYLAAWRARLLPRWLACAGLLTVALHFSVLVVPMFLGLQGVAALGATMALTHFATGTWLLASGYGSKLRLRQ